MIGYIRVPAFSGPEPEAFTVAIRGRPHTRSFGEPTRGLSTANWGFPLSDGAVMNLTTAVFADREGTVYGSKLVPDENVPVEEALDRAVEWLREQVGGP